VLEGWLAQWRGIVDSGSACPSSSPGARLSAGSVLAVSQIGFAAAARFGALGSVLPDSYRLIQKAAADVPARA
jgi:hypothetical protein